VVLWIIPRAPVGFVAFQLILTSRSILSYGLLGNDGAVVDLHIDRDLEVSDLKRVALPMVEGEDETPLRIGTVNCGLPLVLMHGLSKGLGPENLVLKRGRRAREGPGITFWCGVTMGELTSSLRSP
jgi:hypothetical protein